MNRPGGHIYVIGIGSNLPDAPIHVEKALSYLERELTDFYHSKIYSTPPAGKKITRDYANAVGIGRSAQSLDKLTQQFKHYEKENGRTAADASSGAVVIDLDIVVADGKIVRPRDFEARYFRIGYDEII